MTTTPAPDFTEARYGELVAAAQRRFRFCRMTEDTTGNGIALWRHDVDFSPHRALALARIEARIGVCATYFVLLSSGFYNAFESQTRNVLREIGELGHDIGLHYDASDAMNPAEHEQNLVSQAGVLSNLAGRQVRSYSLHNPTVSGHDGFEGWRAAGLVNATAASLRETFAYASDSNGLWRFRSLHDLVEDPAVVRLYALTHAEWWTPEAMSPRARVLRCLDGRVARLISDYDVLLKANGRPNQ